MLSNKPHDIWRAISKVEQARIRGHNELAEIINEMSAQQAKFQQREQIDTIKEIVTHSYTSGIHYTNLIIVAGYAAFFTVWKSMKEDLGKIVMLSSCLSVLISVILFIVAEIHKMASTTIFQRKFFTKFKDELPLTFVDDYNKAAQKHNRYMFRVWLVYFLPTVLFGILGGLLLLYAFLGSLINEIIAYIQS